MSQAPSQHGANEGAQNDEGTVLTIPRPQAPVIVGSSVDQGTLQEETSSEVILANEGVFTVAKETQEGQTDQSEGIQQISNESSTATLGKSYGCT